MQIQGMVHCWPPNEPKTRWATSFIALFLLSLKSLSTTPSTIIPNQTMPVPSLKTESPTDNQDSEDLLRVYAFLHPIIPRSTFSPLSPVLRVILLFRITRLISQILGKSNQGRFIGCI